ncbi:hypothetical protein DFQ30_004123 [Apophysomyces sp. BC1015]|nr:hypothetical protein DFQ30_004123 [Apophysomyces sp. BC1015]
MPGNHSKKNNDRRDSAKQPQQRKNSSARKDNTNKNNVKPIPHAEPDPALSPAFHVSLNNFNSAEVVQCLNLRFSDTLTSYHDTNIDSSLRPEKYESQEKAWGNKGGLPSVWGQKGGTMASGADFLTEVVHRLK